MSAEEDTHPQSEAYLCMNVYIRASSEARSWLYVFVEDEEHYNMKLSRTHHLALSR